MSRPYFDCVLVKMANAMSKGTCHVVCPQGRHDNDLPLEVGGGRSVWFCVSSHDLWWLPGL